MNSLVYNPPMEVLHRYLQCAVSGQPANTGVPDGDSRLSIIRNFRFINTLKPNSNGFLDFYLSVTPDGVIDQLGGAQAATNWWKADAAGSGGVIVDPQTATSRRLIPNYMFTAEQYSTTLLTGARSYRVVNSVNTLSFTGASLYDSGTVYCSPVSASTFDETIPTLSKDRVVTRVGPVAEPVLNASTYYGRAKDSFTVLMLPRDTSYAPVVGSSIGTIPSSSSNTIPFVPGAVVGETMVGAVPHPSIRTYRVRYAGLNTEASITIESRVCIQYLVDPDGNEATLAKPSEFTDPNLLQTVLGTTGSSPLIKAGVNVVGKMIKDALATRAPVLKPLLELI